MNKIDNIYVRLSQLEDEYGLIDKDDVDQVADFIAKSWYPFISKINKHYFSFLFGFKSRPFKYAIRQCMVTSDEIMANYKRILGHDT